jgi:hypothetical protein
VRFESALKGMLQQRGGPLNAEMSLFLEAPEGLVLFQF